MGRVRARRGRSGDVYYQVVRKRMNEEAGNRASLKNYINNNNIL